MFSPSDTNIFVVPDLHGNIKMLDLLLTEVLPLRNGDKVIFMGDYIDRCIDSHLVIDRLIEIKKKYEACVFLKGNHEYMVLVASGLIKKSQDSQDGNFRMWMANGGRETLQGYLNRNKSVRSLDLVRRGDIKSIIPKEHLQFMLDTIPLHEEDEFIFVHGGLNPEPQHIATIKDNISDYAELICWDRSLYETVEADAKDNIFQKWDKCIVTGHNGSKLLITDSFMMLDSGSPRELLLVEVNSRRALRAHYPLETGKTAWETESNVLIEEISIKNTVFKAGKIKRVQ